MESREGPDFTVSGGFVTSVSGRWPDSVFIWTCGWFLVGSDDRFPFPKGFPARRCKKSSFSVVLPFSAVLLHRRVSRCRGPSAVRAIRSPRPSGALFSRRERASRIRKRLAPRWLNFARPTGRRFTLSCAAAAIRSHDAQDLTQSFFAYLIEKKIYARADRREGKVSLLPPRLVQEFTRRCLRSRANAQAGGGQDFLPLKRTGRSGRSRFFKRIAERKNRLTKTGFSNERGRRRW